MPRLSRPKFLAILIGAASASMALALDRSAAADEAVATVGGASGPDPEQGIPIAGWMFYPNFFAGAVFNDNIYATPIDRKSAWGVRLRPAVQGSLDNGLHSTALLLSADAQIYPGSGALAGYASPTNVTASAGARHLWKPFPDLTVQVTGSYTRQNGLFGSSFGLFSSAVIPNASTISSQQQYANQFNGSISVQKSFGHWFLGGATGINYIFYDSRPWDSSSTGNQNRGQAGTSYVASLRGGYWVTPSIYAFAEPGAVINRYRISTSDSNGYRVIGGLGSDPNGLLRGEIFGGYSQQITVATGAAISSPTFGARLIYRPTPYLTLTTSVDQSIGSGAPGNFFGLQIGSGAGSKTWQARAQAEYALSPYWSASLRGGYGESRWLNDGWWNGGGFNLNWTAGAHLNYDFWRNLSLTFDYQFTRAMGYGGSNAWPLLNPFAPNGYAQNLVTAGLTYRY
ncbi:outer membrane beta-barrel protein [Methylosinus sporium]|nr:outer membrane beta-barrel protein [Methylosinus sporium]